MNSFWVHLLFFSFEATLSFSAEKLHFSYKIIPYPAKFDPERASGIFHQFGFGKSRLDYIIPILSSL
jgi:hypothetical protein